MRTKTLLLVAAISAVGLATSLAQSTNVYSANIVGYVNYVNVPGYAMIANPLNSTNNTVQNIFASPPDYLTIFKRNAAGTGYDRASFDPDVPGWDNPTLTLAPGEGCFLYNPLVGNYTNTFIGEVVLNSTNPIPTGFAIRGSVVPQSGGLQTVLGLPLTPADPQNTVVYRLKPFPGSVGGGYGIYRYDTEDLGGTWTSSESPVEPAPAVGEGFWINNPAANGAKSWIRNFTVN